MNFENYLNQAWNDHPTQSEKIAKEFSQNLSLVETNEQLDQWVRLITHVMGEHLGQWTAGADFLKSLFGHSAFKKGTETEKSILRSIAALQVGGGQAPDLKSFSLSDQIRIYAVAASALADQNTSQAQVFLQTALKLVTPELQKSDPAHRSLAITGNNLACALEEKKNRTSVDTELMILSAQTGRKHWEMAGTWSEVSSAEYRLAMTFVQADDLDRALKHGQTCLQIRESNQAEAVDMFYAHEALAVVAQKKMQFYFEKLSDDDKKWCEPILKKFQ